MRELPHTLSCFVCGEANPLGLNLRFETDGRIVRARYRPRVEHSGFKGVVHGGLIATVLDEIMVWACVVQTKRFAFCAEFDVRFLRRIPPGQEVLVTGELVENRSNRIFAVKAEVTDESGAVLTRATGRYMPVKAANLAEMVSDFVGDAAWVVER